MADRRGSGGGGGGKARVRFRSSAGLVQVKEVPLREHQSRIGHWEGAPEDDAVWDGDEGTFRSKELTPDELAEVLQKKIQARRQKSLSRRISGLFAKNPKVVVREKLLAEQSEEGSYKIDEDESESGEHSAGELMSVTHHRFEKNDVHPVLKKRQSSRAARRNLRLVRRNSKMAALTLTRREALGFVGLSASLLVMIAIGSLVLGQCINQVPFLKANFDHPYILACVFSLERALAFLIHAPLLPRPYRRNIRDAFGGARGPYANPDPLTYASVWLFRESERYILEELLPLWGL